MSTHPSSPSYTVNSKVIVKKSRGRGRGIFANQNFKPGEIIEISPMFILSLEDAEFITEERLQLANNLFEWEELQGGGWSLAFACGVGMLFNHSYEPNAEYIRDYKKQALIFKAVEEIKEGAEIFINYNGDVDSQEEVWFEAI